MNSVCEPSLQTELLLEAIAEAVRVIKNKIITLEEKLNRYESIIQKVA